MVSDNPETFADLDGHDCSVPNSLGASGGTAACSAPKTNTPPPPGGNDPSTGDGTQKSTSQQAQQQNEQAREAHSDAIITSQFENVFGQNPTQKPVSLGAHNGHENEEITTKDTSGFESKFKSHEVHTPNNTARFDIKVNGRSYNLHVEFPHPQGPGQVSVQVHIDVGNPSRDLVGAIRHLVIDVGIGKAEYPNSAGLDPY
ncbi:MAG: hypothetical protein ACYC92_12075 [Candidatus Acidiferrales bacterium]